MFKFYGTLLPVLTSKKISVDEFGIAKATVEYTLTRIRFRDIVDEFSVGQRMLYLSDFTIQTVDYTFENSGLIKIVCVGFATAEVWHFSSGYEDEIRLSREIYGA